MSHVLQSLNTSLLRRQLALVISWSSQTVSAMASASGALTICISLLLKWGSLQRLCLYLLCIKLHKLQLCVTKLHMGFMIKPKYSLLLKRNLGLIWMLELERYTHILSWYCSCKLSNFSSLILWKLNAAVLCAVAAVGACSDRVDLQHLKNKIHCTLVWVFFHLLFRVLFVLWSWPVQRYKIRDKMLYSRIYRCLSVAEHNIPVLRRQP